MSAAGLDGSAEVRVARASARRGRTEVLVDVELTVARGELVGLTGANGSGKSTLLLLLAAVLRPASGRVVIGGHDTVRRPHRVHRHVGLVVDHAGWYEGLTVAEHLRFCAEAQRVARGEVAGVVAALLELVDLEGERDARIATLSRGRRQRLALAQALVHDPPVLLLDEPAAGLDPEGGAELHQLIGEVHDLGKTVVVAAGDLGALAERCTRIGRLSEGRLELAETPASLGGTS